MKRLLLPIENLVLLIVRAAGIIVQRENPIPTDLFFRWEPAEAQAEIPVHRAGVKLHGLWQGFCYVAHG